MTRSEMQNSGCDSSSLAMPIFVLSSSTLTHWMRLLVLGMGSFGWRMASTFFVVTDHPASRWKANKLFLVGTSLSGRNTSWDSSVDIIGIRVGDKVHAQACYCACGMHMAAAYTSQNSATTVKLYKLFPQYCSCFTV